jgi:hypothetical protein
MLLQEQLVRGLDDAAAVRRDHSRGRRELLRLRLVAAFRHRLSSARAGTRAMRGEQFCSEP